VHGLKNSSRRRFGLAFEIARNSSLSLHLIQLISIGGTSQSDIARQPGLGEVEHRHLAHVGPRIGYWGATEQKTRLRIQATSTIESDGLRSGRNRRMATIRDRLGHMTATQRLRSIKYLLMRASLRPVCCLWVNRSSTASQRAASAARVPIELTHNPV
jgi:hypothetical protein